MEIHGTDIILKGTPPTDEDILSAVRKFFPDLVFERYDDSGRGLLIYRDEAAKKSWDEKGWSAENDVSLVHVLFGKNSLTVVVDDGGRNRDIVAGITALMLGTDAFHAVDIHTSLDLPTPKDVSSVPMTMPDYGKFQP
jgi:hypothetical protein